MNEQTTFPFGLDPKPTVKSAEGHQSYYSMALKPTPQPTRVSSERPDGYVE